MFNDMLLQHGIGKSGSKNIKSVQRGYILFSNTETSKNLAIDAVDINKSIIKVSAVTTKSLYLSQLSVAGEIINSNTINLKRALGGGMANELVVFWEVLEFEGIKKIQKGVTSISGVFNQATQTYSKTINVEPVNVDKSIIFHTYTVTANVNHIIDSYSNASLAGPSSIRMDYSRDFTREVKWQLVEFK